MLKVKVTLDFLHEPGMEKVACAVSDDGPYNRSAQEIQISQKVQDLMADQLIAEAEMAVDYPGLPDHHRVVE